MFSGPDEDYFAAAFHLQAEDEESESSEEEILSRRSVPKVTEADLEESSWGQLIRDPNVGDPDHFQARSEV